MACIFPPHPTFISCTQHDVVIVLFCLGCRRKENMCILLLLYTFFFPSSTRYAVDKNKKVFTPGDWQQFSETNLNLASSQIKRCLETQSLVDGVLAATASALRSQKDFTDRAFRYICASWVRRPDPEDRVKKQD